jgi:sulfur-oxidizing protein SoxX
MRQTWCVMVLGGLALLLGPAGASLAQAPGHAGHGQAPATPAAPTSQRITMEALHASGGVPPGWRFTVPTGDAAAGRQAFVDLKCYGCHAIKGEQFPLKPGEAATAGPELSGMGGYHPAEYLAESIANPSAVLVDGPGYIGGDGRSIMPSYPDMTLGQLVNLVAYLKTLGAPEEQHAHEPALEQMVGGYRVRLVYKPADPGGHMHHGHGAMAMSQAPGRLLVYLTDQGGQPIPHTPVRARIAVPGKPARMVQLGPALGPGGFHYGVDIALPAATNRITLSIGPAALQLGPDAPEGLKRAQTAAFQWK